MNRTTVVTVENMAVLIYIAIVLSLSGAWSAVPDSRIVGGTPAGIEVYPSIVQVQAFAEDANVWWTFCGASILNEIYVVSAGHCFEEVFFPEWSWVIDAGYRRIKAGSKDLNAGGVDSVIAEIRMHPDYNPFLTGLDDDICLIRLRTPLVFSNVIQPVIIVPQDFVVPDNSQVQYAGWGALYAGGSGPNELHHVTVPKIGHEECQRRYGDVIVSPRQLCAGAAGRGSCFGDSGGPVYFNGVLIGIVSWGDGDCDHSVRPGVNTRVANFTDWIVANAV